MGLWSELHVKTLIPTIFVFLGISILLGYLLRNKDEKIRMIPIQVISVILVVLEIMKQIYAAKHGYKLDYIPLHFCSLFLFALPFFAFYKGKYKDQMRTFAIVCCAVTTLLMFVGPTLIYQEGSIPVFFKQFLRFHTIVFHNLVILAMMLIVSLKLYSFDTKRDMKVILISYPIYCAVAATMSNLLKTNFNNFYYCEIAGLEQIRLSLVNSMGVGGQLLYIIGVSVMVILFAILAYWVLRLVCFVINKITNAIKTKKENKRAKNKA